jgi:predicted dehydrogenase
MAARHLGIAVVGAGVAARYHARAVAAVEAARLVAVCRSDPGRRAAAEAEFGVPCETDFETLLARDDLDAVCLCTPSGLHAAQAVAAARAGKHVLVEKPMALSTADADAMIAACRDARVCLAVTFQRRTEPVYVTLKDALAGGRLGQVVLGTVSVPYYRPPSYYAGAAWRGSWALDGGGALMNQGIHLVDLLVWLLGDVLEVTGARATLAHPIEAEDALTATLRFAGGALGAVTATTAAAPGFPHRLEVYGTRGGAQIEGESVVRWENERGQSVAAGPPAGAGAGASATGIGTTAHARIVADFVAAVRDRRPPLVDGEEGRRALAVVLAIYESARTGRPARPG